MNSHKTSYKNFNVAVYCRAEDVQRMADTAWLEAGFDLLQKHVKINKVYLETFRGQLTVKKDLMLRAKDFFANKGIKTSGGITPAPTMGPQFQSFCYTNPEHREKLKEIVAYTAELFDEVILDDFFFTNCKCELCIRAKGRQSWTDFRLAQMVEVSQNLVIEPAKSVNPQVNMIIKYPNWYDHFHFTGYNLEAEPPLFDMIYTGTEARDSTHHHQHLQHYHSYAIMRYLEHVKSGKNGGGWIDPYVRRTLDRYGEQIELTLFAKPREVTLFCFGSLLESVKQQDGLPKLVSMVAPVAASVFEQADSFLDQLGQPYGLASYKPYHTSGEDYLPNYIGMLGIPIDLVPEFPTNSKTLLLTECAAFDDEIVAKIQGQLLDGKRVVITSGLLKALQGRGIEEIVELEYTDKKALVREFSRFADVYHSDTDLLIPQIKYATNDSWELITCLDKDNGYPLLLEIPYGNSALYVLTIPDNFSDLYHLPPETLTQVKQVLMQDFPVYLESASKVCLFIYDNNTLIVHSFLPYRSNCHVVVGKESAKLYDLMSDEEINGDVRADETVFAIWVQPHSYRVFRFE
jgi:hypothetical protein